uniref:SAM domain-containing protein n=1 Tax=Meloidogyne hapla TaxID=6305 RepID=A0A1I8B564_MELHA
MSAGNSCLFETSTPNFRVHDENRPKLPLINNSTIDNERIQLPPSPQWDIRVLNEPFFSINTIGAFLLLDELCLNTLGVSTLGAKKKIMHAVTTNCEHISLIDCNDYKNKEMECRLTATGMICCICKERLKLMRHKRL